MYVKSRNIIRLFLWLNHGKSSLKWLLGVPLEELIDARNFSREFYPALDEDAFINLLQFQFHLKLSIDGIAMQAFSASLNDESIVE